MTPKASHTPTLDQLLARLHARLVREVWLFGLGRMLLGTAVWLLFIFLVDWTLHVPAGVRMVHLGVLCAIPVLLLWRDLVLRLRRVPGPEGLAVLLERAHPELKEVLVSAVQLRDGRATLPGSEIDPALVANVVAEAERRAGTLALKGTSNPRPSRTSFGLGAAAVLSTLLTLTLQADSARTFFARIAGGSTQWPQKTFLVIEVPLAGELNTTRDSLELSIARGSDLPIVVRAEGRIPDEVTLRFAGGQETLLGSAGRGVFRTLLRAVQEDLSFTVSGGDDQDGTPSVTVNVLQPPDIAGLAIRVEPPAYSGLAPRLEFDRDMQVLIGSKITITMLPDPPDARGIVRLLPQDEVLELTPAEYPVGEGQAPRPGLAFELTARESLRYRFELRDSTGLSNPDPGLFAIQVREDRPPEVSLLAPTRGEIESVVGGALPLKVLATDDFGLREVRWHWMPTSSGATGVEESAALATSEPTDLEALRDDERGNALAFASRRIEIDELFGEATPTEGEVFQLVVSSTDNREPTAQETRSPAVRVRVVSADEFLRRIQDRLARVRGKAEALAALMRDKQSYTQDLIAALESDEPGRADGSAVSAALTGARRVEGDAAALSREIAAIAESLIYSRIDDRADAMLVALEERTRGFADRSFHPEPWIELAAMQSDGRLGGADFADKLVEIVGVALAISEDDSPAAVDGLRRAQDLADIGAQFDQLVEAAERQSAARDKAEQLLSLLSEWDSYQSLLSATRDLLNRQKNLLDRTRQFYKDN